MASLPAGCDVREGLRQLAHDGFVSFVMVADPLAGPPTQALAAAFDRVRPFKTHYVVDPSAYAPGKHHRAEIRRALRRCEVERGSLAESFDTWKALYAGLVDRRAVRGLAAFSEAYWRMLAAMPELAVFAARVDGEVVAMSLWFAHEGVGYNHLGASSGAGYAVGASYALYDAAVAHFGDCRALNLGGGAGLVDEPSDGLARFKRGFATGTVVAHLCGQVLDPARYAALSRDRRTTFFPAYRG